MIKHYLLILLGLLILDSVLAQDRIAKKDGTILHCNIISIDSNQIRYCYYDENRNMITYIDNTEVLFYKHKDKIIYLQKKPTHQLTPEIIFADSIERSGKNFVYFYSNKILYGNSIEYKKPFLDRPYVLVDNIKYNIDDIKFVKQYSDFYANSKFLNPYMSSAFAIRISSGKINLYQRETRTHYVNQGYSFSSIFNYYNKGFSDLKKANYKNLRMDLADDPESMMHLEKYKIKKQIQNGFYITGIALLVGGFISTVNKTKDWDGKDGTPEPNVTPNIVVCCTGAVCFFVGYGLSLSKPKHLKDAIDVYNQ